MGEDDSSMDESGQLMEELRKEKERSAELEKNYKYLLADYDNYRKRLEKEADFRVRLELEKFLLKLLSLRDDYTRAVDAAKKSTDKDIASGLEGVLKNLDAILKEAGITEIDAVGKPFDPNFHEAVSFTDSELEENTVSREIRKGYILNDRVIRPSLVEVTKRSKIETGDD